jgi:hypothetical protein
MYEASNNTMIDRSKALKLKGAMKQYRNFLLSMTNKRNTTIRQIISKTLETHKPDNTDGSSYTWKREHFKDKPLMGVVSELSSMEINN